MKFLFSVLFCLIISNSYGHTNKVDNFTPDIYEVFDLTNNKKLLGHNDNQLHSIASLTKLMTAHTFLKYYKEPLNNCVSSISDNENDNIKHTHTRIERNKKISCESLLQLMLLVSDNYAASTISGSIPGVSKEKFYDLMNNEAKNLQMNQTFYKDSSGLSFENQSTANDLINLIKISLTNEKLKQLASTYAVNMTEGDKTILFQNSNKLVRENIYDTELSKTGYITESGYNLIFVPKNKCNDKKIAIVIMGAKSSNARTIFAIHLLDMYGCTKN